MKDKTKLRIDSVAESRDVSEGDVKKSLKDEMRDIMNEVLENGR